MKKIFVAIVGLMLALYAKADSYLYWMLDEVQDDRLQFAVARIVAQDAEGNNQWLKINGGSSSSIMAVGADRASGTLGTQLTGAYYAALPSSYSHYSFFVELYNWEGNVIGTSELIAYSALSDSIYQDMGISGVTTPYHFSAAVPEPSCGLLVLFGLGLLGLKRRERGGGRVEV